MEFINIIPFNIFFIFSYLLFCGKCSSSKLPLVPALYVFGDSLFDSGNNNFLPTLAKANYYPYGVNFPGSFPTGRFTNGKTTADFIADYLGLPYPTPRVSLIKPTSLTGYNYASGSCGILPETGKFVGECLNLDEQMKMFETTVKIQLGLHFRNRTELAQYLAKSIFIFSVGNNDYINTYFGIVKTRQHYSPPQFAKLLVDSLSRKLQRLYDLGARKIVVFELGPIGCIPSIMRGLRPKGIKCDENKNKIVSLFNNELGLMLNNLSLTLQHSHFIIGRAHSLAYDAIINPAKYGLRDSSNPCCKSWLNGTFSCIPELTPCSAPDEHFFWDGYHLTEATCSVVASHCINGSDVCLPINIQQLVQA
ncbi:GDSL esterase/lipase 7-like [Amaranthus tricolor]|uniref:GDSL esterase/lipase 7-like n=1 Tax=Amaranthus tricolor TaxID=29722 RepID=UPI00258A36D9|nr:GDSL esterase/lipase 7-like [Amaranthus tricolor]